MKQSPKQSAADAIAGAWEHLAKGHKKSTSDIHLALLQLLNREAFKRRHEIDKRAFVADCRKKHR